MVLSSHAIKSITFLPRKINRFHRYIIGFFRLFCISKDRVSFLTDKRIVRMLLTNNCFWCIINPFAGMCVEIPPYAANISAGMVELADTMDLGSIGQPCRFKSCYPHFLFFRFFPEQRHIFSLTCADDCAIFYS